MEHNTILFFWTTNDYINLKVEKAETVTTGGNLDGKTINENYNDTKDKSLKGANVSVKMLP